MVFGLMWVTAGLLTLLYFVLGRRRFARVLLAGLVLMVALQPLGLQLRPAQAFVLQQSADQASEKSHQQKQQAAQARNLAQEEWKPELSPIIQNAAFMEGASLPASSLTLSTLPTLASQSTNSTLISQDSDSDGLSDGEEVLRTATNPLSADTDFARCV
jgi:hypothetical protein